jgi:uncharacterized Zn-binding protein involved in type VI secretion
MATAIARIGDTLDHGGMILTGSPNWQCNGIAIARVGDTAHCNIHGTVTITTGSPNWTVNSQAMARIGSLCSCGAVINSGSSNWNVS